MFHETIARRPVGASALGSSAVPDARFDSKSFAKAGWSPSGQRSLEAVIRRHTNDLIRKQWRFKPAMRNAG